MSHSYIQLRNSKKQEIVFVGPIFGGIDVVGSEEIGPVMKITPQDPIVEGHGIVTRAYRYGMVFQDNYFDEVSVVPDWMVEGSPVLVEKIRPWINLQDLRSAWSTDVEKDETEKVEEKPEETHEIKQRFILKDIVKLSEKVTHCRLLTKQDMTKRFIVTAVSVDNTSQTQKNRGAWYTVHDADLPAVDRSSSNQYILYDEELEPLTEADRKIFKFNLSARIHSHVKVDAFTKTQAIDALEEFLTNSTACDNIKNLLDQNGFSVDKDSTIYNLNEINPKSE